MQHITWTIPYKPRLWQKQVHQGLREKRWACVVAHRRAGKTVCLVVHLLMAAAESQKNRPLFAYVAPYYKQAKQLAWEYLKDYSVVFEGRKINESELWVELPHNGAKIRLFGCDNPDALRGLYFDGVVLDEFADMHPEAWESVIRPALSDRHGWACLSGTPRGHNAFFQVYREAQVSPEWFCGLYRAEETHALAQEELTALRREMAENRYRQEYQCDFDVAAADALIPLPLVLEATERQMGPENLQPIILGVDVARFGDDSSVLFARQGRDARLWPPQVFQCLDTMQLAARVIDFTRQTKAAAVFVDGGGVGGGVIDRLHQLGLDAVEVNFGSKSDSPDCLNKRAEMWVKMREWLKVGALPNIPRLTAELTGVLYSFDPSNALKLEAKEDIKKRGMPSPDIADALALTFAYPVQALSLVEEVGQHFERSKGYDPLASFTF